MKDEGQEKRGKKKDVLFEEKREKTEEYRVKVRRRGMKIWRKK